MAAIAQGCTDEQPPTAAMQLLCEFLRTPPDLIEGTSWTEEQQPQRKIGTVMFDHKIGMNLPAGETVKTATEFAEEFFEDRGKKRRIGSDNPSKPDEAPAAVSAYELVRVLFLYAITLTPPIHEFCTRSIRI